MIDFARQSHNTISFFNFSKPESLASKWNRISLNAARVIFFFFFLNKGLIFKSSYWIRKDQDF